MTLEEVVKKALSDNADCLGGECDCVALGVAKAVRGFLLSDEVVERAGVAIKRAEDDGYWSDDGVKGHHKTIARAALSSITGDE